ncbi:lycopene beta-cyclase CrtY [Litorimonas haliclonae]|uniref:lycopene beta-cyclase CrtY n=1 Tax=Litorimonas haliclonae TaxID=2081977 RepID=UPI0039F01F50
MDKKPDMIIVGAGLSGLLTAWRCLDVNPNLTVLVIEASEKIAGDHTWSFNLTDVEESLRDWIKPFIAYQWPRYDVKFAKRERTLEIPYCTGNSETLRACVEPFIQNGRLHVMLKTKVASLDAESVTLENGETMDAACVLDARGFAPNENVFLGYQKFVGKTIRTKEPHGLRNPVIMDATVEQLGGYRFVYCLPFTEHEILVEDTYYTDGPELSETQVATRVDDYINKKGWGDHELLRKEKGVLPITLAVDYDHSLGLGRVAQPDGKIGISGGFYNAVTGYSFPSTLYLADEIAKDIENIDAYAVDDISFLRETTIATAHANHVYAEKFLRLLNRMLFRACEPDQRYKVLQRFYGLPQDLIERFYAGKLTQSDKARILIGKPPVPVTKALYNFSEKAFIKRERAKRDNA